jgi:Xaa-Pro aminopeptidase
MNGSRIDEVRKRMLHLRIDALIVSSISNIRYLTSFSGSHALCIITSRSLFFLTDPRYGNHSSREVRGFKRIVSGGSLIDAARNKGVFTKCKRVGFEAGHSTYATYRSLKRALPAARFVATDNLIEDITVAKSPLELRQIRRAVSISDEVFTMLLGIIKPGVRECDVAAEISYQHRRLGADADAFEPIVASGVRGALPHARATTRKVKSGEMVTLDFGCRVNGFHSDMTRTVAVGKVTRKARQVYAAVLEAQQRAVTAARTEMRVSDLDKIARDCIKAHGYGRYFIHSLGHGLGINLHEKPRISKMSDERLRADSVVTIEPGVYIDGFGGVRIEDDLLLTRHGSEVLTRSPKELMIL